MGETAVYPRELRERREPEEEAPFRDHFTGLDERGASPSAPYALTGVLSTQNILKNKKTLE